MVTRLAIPAAARVLGISIPTVKRRLQSGALSGVQEPTPSGFRWLVEVESPESDAQGLSVSCAGLVGHGAPLPCSPAGPRWHAVPPRPRTGMHRGLSMSRAAARGPGVGRSGADRLLDVTEGEGG
jgi:hypothetical protein